MPRRVATLVCAIALGAAAVLGFASGTIRHAFSNGQPGTYWVLGAGAVGLAASVVLSWRARKAHAGFWAACIALPQIASLASSVRSGRNLDSAIDGVVGDVVARIVAEGTAEITLATTLGDLFSAACATTVAIGLHERAAAESRPSAKRVLAVGGVWVVASIVLFALSVRGHELGVRPLMPILAVVMVAIAVLSRGEREVAPLVACAGIMAVLFVERAIGERARATAFGDLSMEATTPIERAQLLAGYLVVRGEVRLAMATHAVLGAATFIAAMGFPRRTMMSMIAVLGLVAAMTLREHRAFVRRMNFVRTAFDVGVPLPTTGATFGSYVGADRLVVTRAGTLSELIPPGEIEERVEPADEGEHFGRARFAKAVFAHADLTCGALVAALQPKVRPRLSFALAAVHSTNVPHPFVSDLEPLVGDRELVGLGFDLNRHYAWIDAVVSGDTFVLKLPGEADLTYALTVDPDEVARVVKARRPEPLPKRDTVQLTVHASDSVRRLASALGILTVAFPFGNNFEHRYFALRVE